MSKSSATKSKTQPSGAERRRSKRTEVLDTFSLFASVPKKGPHRLRVHDLSEIGIGFDLDIEEEDEGSGFPVENGTPLEIHLYLNQSLYIPMKVVVRRVEKKGNVRRIGAETAGDKSDPATSAILSFIKMLESISDVAVTTAG